jgi:hypothetical protein
MKYSESFEFDYSVLNERLRIKQFTEAGTLDDQGQHLALNMSISRTAHTEGEERESTSAKRHQGKN